MADMTHKRLPDVSYESTPQDDRTVKELLESSRRGVARAREYLASAERRSEEFKRLERLRGYPIFFRRY